MATAHPVSLGLSIGAMTDADWDAVCAIYDEGIATGNATIETVPPTWEVWNARHLKHCRLVARRGDEVIGVAEVSVYIAERARSQGVGHALLDALIAESERHGIWTLQAGIFPENTISIALHTKCGFRQAGMRERLGKLNGAWRDVILLERRSATVGVD